MRVMGRLSNLVNLPRRLLRHEAGGVSAVMGLSLLPMLGLVGGAVDYSRAAALRVSLQSAADAAALAGAGRLATPAPGGDGAQATAERVLQSMIGSIQNPPQVTVNDTSRTVTVVASSTLQTAFMRIMRVNTIPVSAEAAARVLPPSGPPVCFHALEPTATAMNASGGAKIEAAPCITWFNTSSQWGVNVSGGSTVRGLRNCVAAGAPTGFTPPAERCAPRPDPYADYNPATPAATSGCTRTNMNISGSSSATVTFQPCIYNGGITISGSSPIVFSPGVHVIRGGALNISGSNTITATGVTFVLENGASVNLSGVSVSYNLTAPTSGDFAGFVFYQRPSTTIGAFNLSGSNSFHFEGAIYLPSQTVNISGSNTSATASPFTAFIARSYNLSGSSPWALTYDPSRMTVRVPAKLHTGSGAVALVR